MAEYKESPNLTIRVKLENGRLPREMKEWLAGNIEPVTCEDTPGFVAEGTTWGAWFIRDMDEEPSIIVFRFKTRDQALLFKLRWG